MARHRHPLWTHVAVVPKNIKMDPWTNATSRLEDKLGKNSKLCKQPECKFLIKKTRSTEQNTHHPNLSTKPDHNPLSPVPSPLHTDTKTKQQETTPNYQNPSHLHFPVPPPYPSPPLTPQKEHLSNNTRQPPPKTQQQATSNRNHYTPPRTTSHAWSITGKRQAH